VYKFPIYIIAGRDRKFNINLEKYRVEAKGRG